MNAQPPSITSSPNIKEDTILETTLRLLARHVIKKRVPAHGRLGANKLPIIQSKGLVN